MDPAPLSSSKTPFKSRAPALRAPGRNTASSKRNGNDATSTLKSWLDIPLLTDCVLIPTATILRADRADRGSLAAEDSSEESNCTGIPAHNAR
jgi:hypothetical protein